MKKKKKKPKSLLKFIRNSFIFLIGFLIWNGLYVGYLTALHLQEVNASTEQKILQEQELREKPVNEIIDVIAPQYGINDTYLLKKIVHCESGGNKEAIHDKGYGYGPTGILRTTFNYWNTKMGENLTYENPVHQVRMMSWAFNQGESYKRQWSTYVAYKNGGTYSFYSNLLKGHYTSRCQ